MEAEEPFPTCEVVLSRGRWSLGCGDDGVGEAEVEDTVEFVFGGVWSLEDGLVPKRSKKVGIMYLEQR